MLVYHVHLHFLLLIYIYNIREIKLLHLQKWAYTNAKNPKDYSSVGLAHPATRRSPGAPGNFYLLGALPKSKKILSLLEIPASDSNRINL